MSTVPDVPVPVSDLFKKRRRRDVSPKQSSSSSSFVITSECHFSDDDDKKKMNLPDTDRQHGPNGLLDGVRKQMVVTTSPKHTRLVTTGESRFVPVNADMLSSDSMSSRFKQPYRYHYQVFTSKWSPLSDDPKAGFRRSGQQFHKYPYPHYHIYHNSESNSMMNSQHSLPPIRKTSYHIETIEDPSLPPPPLDETEVEIDGIPHAKNRRRDIHYGGRMPPTYGSDDNNNRWSVFTARSKPKSFSYNYYEHIKPKSGMAASQPRRHRRKTLTERMPDELKRPVPLNDDYDGDGGQGGGEHNDDNDYSVRFGGGNYNEYDKTFDSNKKDRDGSHDDGGGGGGGHDYDYGSDGDGGGGEGRQDDENNDDYY